MKNPPASSPAEDWEVVWTRTFSASAKGLSLSQEQHTLLLWDSARWLHLLNSAGQTQAQRHFPGLTAAAIAEDASALAMADEVGNIRWLAPDLSERWEKRLPEAIHALAVDPHGQYLAAATSGSQVFIFDRTGQNRCQFRVPRPLANLVFVPGVPLLLGCADLGLVLAAKLSGEIVWRDQPLVQVGQLAVDYAGDRLLLACYSDGLHVYHPGSGNKPPRITTPEPCHLVAQTAAGDRALAGSVKRRLLLIDGRGNSENGPVMEQAIVGLALDALGRYAVAALKGGTLKKIALRGEKG
jgi:hypothetical protein